jgi:RHS repeat-associated protein
MNTEITSGHDEAIMEVGSSSINYQVIYDYSNHAYPNLIYRWQCNNVANTDLSYPVSLGTSAWHMIDATFNGTTFTGYLDGVAVVSSTANPGTSCSNGNSNLDLGYIIGSPWWPSAKMDDFAFFNRALTATEIANLYGVTSLVGGAQLQVEVEPAGVTFTSVANVTSSAFVASGTVATTSFSGPSGGYHWQARTVDVLNNTSAWHPFNPAINTPSGFLVDPSSTLTTSLLSYYPMEGNSNDFWGPNNGSDSAMFYGTSYGKVNQGSHNSGSGYITLPIFTVSSSISIAGWFQATSTSGNHDFIVDINNSGGTARIGLQLDSGQLIASMYNGSANPVLYSTSSAYADGNWHFFVETANGMNLTLQVDNGAQQSVSGSQSTWGGNGNRISNLYADSQGFNGNIDELGIWNRLLSSPEVSNLWNSGNGQTMHSLSYGSDFQIDNLYFSYPAYSTTTPQFSNWQLKARNVTSTHSYQVTVNWGLSQPNQATSSITASGTQLLTGVNVSKTLISGDYTDTGDPVGIVASGTLTDITGTSTVISSTSVSFYEKTIPATSNCTSSNIQCISYTYDANGNITKIVDGSASNAAITVSYAYDGLNRLLSASSSNATSGVNYYQAYTYDPVGNLLSGPAGAYTYAGTGYTDPDAVTKIVNGSSTTNFTYDNNGNLTNASSGFAYTWDYNNRMLTASSSNSTSTYGYDFTGQRVSVANGGVTTYYPETTYTVNGTTRTKNIFADGILVGTVTDATTTTAGITLDATSTAKISSASVATSTISVGSGPNELLAILIANGNISATTTGVTVDGVSAKQASLLRNGTQNASVWYVAGLSSGTHNVSTTHSTSTQIALTLASFFGINQSSTIDATSTKNATSNAPSSSVVTSGVGDLILDALDTAATATTTAIGSGQKYLYQNLLQAANNGNYSYQVAAATGTHADSYTLSTSTAWSEALAAFKATTSTTSTSTATNYIFDDHLGGTNLVVNVSGTILETLQYFPFGSIRIDNTTSSYVAVPRKYIGQQYDAATQLNYLNARYQNPAQGQFISEDPMFIALGSPGQLQQLGQDQSSLLADPQRINSYGYGRDNPVTNKDPNGFDYLELSYTRELPGGSWTGGIRIDQNGMDWFAGSGTGYGGGGGVEAEWAPGQNLSHESTVSTNVVGQITDDAGLGIALSKRINGYNTSELYQENTGNSPASFGITLGGGEGGGIDAEGSKPLFIWNQAGALGEQVEELNNGSNITMPHTYLSAPSGSSQASGGGGHMSGNQLAALQAELSTLSLELAQLQSTISMYSSSK